MQTLRGDQLLLSATTLDDWHMLVASGPNDKPVVLTRVDVLCKFVYEEAGLRLVFTTTSFR